MRTSRLWRTLTHGQKQAWRLWARKNPTVLDNGDVDGMNAIKAFTLVMQRRAMAGEPANPGVPPVPMTWFPGGLSLRDAGPFTTNDGYIGFRAEQAMPFDTKWFVWATPVVDGSGVDPHRLLKFIAAFELGPMMFDDITGTLGGQYAAVHGSWDGPGPDGDWSPQQKFIWFRLHQYWQGHLATGILIRGEIEVEL